MTDNRYTVHQPGEQHVVIADDFTLAEGVVVFRDKLGRALELVGVGPDLRITCEYADDPIFEVRAKLADKERAGQLEVLQSALGEEPV